MRGIWIIPRPFLSLFNKLSAGRDRCILILVVCCCMLCVLGGGFEGNFFSFIDPGVPLPHSVETLGEVMSYSGVGKTLCSV